MVKISVCIITLNEEHTIEDCLKSVSWCDEIVLVDSGSTDQTVAICQSMGCRVIYNKFTSFSSQRQLAASLAANDWILFVDADERLSPKLIDELRSLEPKYVAYNINFRTYLYGRLMRSCGLRNEKHIRLYNRKYAKFSDNSVHEQLVVEGLVGSLQNHINHFTHPDLHESLEKINRYTELWSNEKIAGGKKTSVIKVVIQFPFKFIQYYIVRGGIVDGFPGFIYSFSTGVYGTMKYAKLYLKQKTH